MSLSQRMRVTAATSNQKFTVGTVAKTGHDVLQTRQTEFRFPHSTRRLAELLMPVL